MSNTFSPDLATLDPDDFFVRVAQATLDAASEDLSPRSEYRRRASVLVPLFRSEKGPGVLLVKRSEEVSLHRGEISFPGGSVEESDRDPLETALRETEEEIGLRREEVEVIGRLPAGVTAVSSFWVVPYIGLIPDDPSKLTPSPAEVAEVLWVPVAAFLERGVFRVERRAYGGAEVPLYFFELASGEVVWGLTARILHDLLTRVGLSP